jgi:hypothetical protein
VVAANTADDLLVRVKARASIPATEGRLSDPDLLAIADDATRSTIARVLYNSDDGRCVKTQADVALVVDQSAYRLPERAMGGSVYDVLIVDSAGNELSSNYVDSAEAWRYRDSSVSESSPYAHTIEGDTIILLPTPTQAGSSLRIKYRRTPSKLVQLADCAVVASVLSGTDLAYASVPATGWGNGTDHVVDVVQASPHGDSLEDSVFVTVVSASSKFTRAAGAWASTGADAIAGGEFVCDAGFTCVPQIPAAVFPFLVALTTYETLIALGDAQGAADLVPIVELRKREAKALTAERNRERAVVINHDGHLRSGRTRYVYGGG